MKKLFLFIALCLLSLVLFSCTLTGLTVDEAKQNLEEAGYTVTITDGEAYLDSGECPFSTIMPHELDKYLYAEKGEDKIYMYFFYSVNQADNNYGFMQMDGLRSGMNNKTVYFGTKQAVKDSKI